MPANIEVIIGTYEEFLLGYRLDQKNGKEVFAQSFADKSHSGALKCLAVQGSWIATGATDDRIFIYDMKSRKQSQILLTHDGTINALAFTPDETHLLSGGDDGRMIAVRLNTWIPEATWKKAHNGSPVTHISCHPSSKLALSLGSDLILRTWNLVKGRVAYKTNLKSKSTTLGSLPDCLAWAVSGDFFTLTGQRVIEIWSIKTADVVKSHKTASKPVCVCWTPNNDCLVGLEDGKILWITIKEDEKQEVITEAHNARVKAMAIRNDIVVTASSSGEIKMWKIDLNKKKLKEIGATNIGCRPTCIGILDLAQFGSDYTITNITKQTQNEIKPKIDKQRPIPQQQGIVTIEYENTIDKNQEEPENESEDDEDDESDEENEADSVAEEESSASNVQSTDEDIDASIESSNDSETAEEDTDEREKSKNNLPKALKRKPKTHILKVNKKYARLAEGVAEEKTSHSKPQKKAKKGTDKRQGQLKPKI